MQGTVDTASVAAVLDRLCGAGPGPIGVAVSGGGDSVALLLLAHDWAKARQRRLCAFTFDHRLRPGSSAEAAQVASRCASLGIPHQRLCWETPTPSQAAARAARHDALAAALQTAGGRVLLLGHTADDQAETFLLRARQGSTWYGLAGMQAASPSPAAPGKVVLARPLLDISRQALRDYLHQIGAVWVDDPSNDNPAFERIRMRQRLAASPQLGERIARLQSELSVLRSIEDALIARWLCRSVTVEPSGAIVADLAGLPLDRAVRAAGLLMEAGSGVGRPPRRSGLVPLVQRLQAPRAFRGATLGGFLISRVNGHVRFAPEPSASTAGRPAAAILAHLQAVSRLNLGQAATIAAC